MENVSEVSRLTKTQRMRHKYVSTKFAGTLAMSVLRFLLLSGIAFVVLYPLFLRLSTSLMLDSDLLDKTVILIPREFSFHNYKTIMDFTGYKGAFINSSILSVVSALLQTLVSVCVGYGLAKFRFRGRGIVMAAVVFTLLIPPSTILTSLYLQFQFFDFFGILGIFGSYVKLTDTFWPMIIMSATGLALKNGLFIFVMRQSFMGIPDEMLEAAYIDGAGVYRTFGQITMPLNLSQMVTVFLISFCWQWTDSFYSSIFYSDVKLLPNIISAIRSYHSTLTGPAAEYSLEGLLNIGLILIIVPLVIIYLFGQRFIKQGIERSGLTG